MSPHPDGCNGWPTEVTHTDLGNNARCTITCRCGRARWPSQSLLRAITGVPRRHRTGERILERLRALIVARRN